MVDCSINFAIIAAGEGSRLRNEGLELPKALTSVNGTPLIGRLMGLCGDLGATRVYTIINEQSTEAAEYLDTYVDGPEPVYIVKSTPSSLHSFHELTKLLPEGPFCLFTVDTVFRPEEFDAYISAALTAIKTGDMPDGLMAVTSHVDDEKPLWVATGADGYITGFHDSRGECSLVSGGMYIFGRNLRPELEKAVGGGMARMRDFQRYLLESGFRLKAFEFSKIIDVDHKDDIGKAERLLAEV